jgi:hypothetical protein
VSVVVIVLAVIGGWTVASVVIAAMWSVWSKAARHLDVQRAGKAAKWRQERGLSGRRA